MRELLDVHSPRLGSGPRSGWLESSHPDPTRVKLPYGLTVIGY
jgi:hypothetical protein